MKTAIILHGKPSKEGYYFKERDSQSNSHWLPWIQHELLLRDILAQTPELPKPYDPNYEDWLKEFNRFNPNENTLLIGHSCGAGFLIRFLSENNVNVGKVVLVAPYLDPKREATKDFFDFKIDRNISKKTKGVTVFYSDNDNDYIDESVEILKNETEEIKFRLFHNYGHFCYGDMKTREFPELLENII